ncbi:probable UDP-glucosyl transferase 73B6 [Aristolochia californica]|uniref:probable UDP-glucosyl transferase 73B6 n=1 Tax=Aristolochia californica TaxID=171875 RepID=UPI0035E0CD0B
MGSEVRQLHVFLFPFMAHGHMLPMIDIAKLLAARGVRSTIVLTPGNACLFENSVDRAKKAGYPIEVHLLRFSSSGTGLPEGGENFDYVSNSAETLKLINAVKNLEEPFNQLVEEQRPDGIISDMFLPWTVKVSDKLGIPRLVFYGTSYFSLCVGDSLRRFSPEKNVKSDTEPFLVPGLPDPIELTKSQLPSVSDTLLSGLMTEVVEADSKSYGVIQNSFYELEPSYVEHYRKETGKKAWSVGPVSLCNAKMVEMADRETNTSSESNEALRWLDVQKPSSVLYVCFGSLCKFSPAQLAETAMALESSGCPFIWVKKKSEVLPEGFEERIKEKGFIINGWAPQILILNHLAIGGFMTHCGWNSILEGITAGLPMITWPAFAEQFYNEKFVTKVLKIGVGVGTILWVPWEQEDKPIIEREVIQEAVRSIMVDGEEAKRMRKKAKELAAMAKMAVQKGQSSYVDLSCLIEELRMISTQNATANLLQ